MIKILNKHSPTQINVEALVASPEFQEYQKSIEKFAENLRKKYVKLSKSDQNKLIEVFSNLSDQNSHNNKELYEKVSV